MALDSGTGEVVPGQDSRNRGLLGGYLVRAKLRNSINQLPIIRIIPVEVHKLKLQVRPDLADAISQQRASGRTAGTSANKWHIAIIIMARRKFGETVSIKLKGLSG